MGKSRPPWAVWALVACLVGLPRSLLAQEVNECPEPLRPHCISSGECYCWLEPQSRQQAEAREIERTELRLKRAKIGVAVSTVALFGGGATLGVALAQRLAPQGKSMASSLIMGLAYGSGGLLTPLTGKLADIFGIQPVLSALALIPLLTAVLIYYFFKKEPSPAGI